MRRKEGILVPLELEIVEAGLDLQRRGTPEFHGFAMAKRIQEREGARRLTAHGTLYKALARLQRAGLLESRWENPEEAADEDRPRRRFYQVTAEAEIALTRHTAASASSAGALRLGMEHP